MNPGRFAAGLFAVGVVAALTAPGSPTATSAQASASAPTTLSVKPVHLTLVTGDTVTVSARGAAFDPAPGRLGIPVERRTIDGEQYVIPADALPLLRSGRLDMQLFDITALQKFGYTGERDLPLLVQYPKSGVRKGPAGALSALRKFPTCSGLTLT